MTNLWVGLLLGLALLVLSLMLLGFGHQARRRSRQDAGGQALGAVLMVLGSLGTVMVLLWFVLLILYVQAPV